MSDPSPINPGTSSQTPKPENPFDQAEFLRRIYDRSLQEMERTRDYFENLLNQTIAAIGVIVVVATTAIGILGFRSWNDIQTRMETKLQDTQHAIEGKGQQAIQETDRIIRERAEAAFKEETSKPLCAR